MAPRIGISVTSFHAVDDPRLAVETMLRRTRAARDAGLSSLFVGDHHATPRPYLQNTPILARLLAEWDQRPAGALYLLPLWHPVLVAEQVATLDAIARGPFVLQCALGEGQRQFSAFGVDPRHRPSRFEQSLDVIRRLLAGEEVNSEGRYSIAGARISPLPSEPVAVWIGASADVAIDRAARLGSGWIASPSLVPEEAKRQIELYRERCAAHGREGIAVIRRDFFVGADAEEARRTAVPVIEAGYRGIDPRALVVGDPEQVAESLAATFALGYDEVLVRSLAPGDDAIASIERLDTVRALLGDGPG